MDKIIGITALASASPLGNGLSQVWQAYNRSGHCLAPGEFGGKCYWVGALEKELKAQISAIGGEGAKYAHLDDSVMYAIFAARKAFEMAGWPLGSHFGINIGSSRGATGLFEKYHTEYLKENRSPVWTSPTTTLGNISSWVAHDLQSRGPEISHSITCSTALHALINGVAWLRSGMADRFMVGGSEAPLTPFTISQMRALKIYASFLEDEIQDYPCRALDLEKSRNSMVLGEGSCIACLEEGVSDRTLAVVEGIGYATEPLEHSASLSADAICLQRSMKMALGSVDPASVQVAVLHAPGTIKGDLAEWRAVKHVFGDKLPALTTNKWKVGHTFATSGMLSLELAVLMLLHQQFIAVPFIPSPGRVTAIERVLINAVGFGGNAVSIMLRSV